MAKNSISNKEFMQQLSELIEPSKSANIHKSALGPKIVVIDDSIEMLSLIENFVTQDNVGEVWPFNNEFNALNYIAHNPVDLVVIDVHLTTVDGFKVGEMVRSILKDETPLVYITADDKELIHFYKAEQRNSYFMKKPFNKKVFKNVISNMLTTVAA